MKGAAGADGAVAEALDGRAGEAAAPALGGGGTGDCVDGKGFVAVGSGMAPGCGGAGDCKDVVVGALVVGVAVRLPGSCEAAVAVGAGTLGAAPG